MLNGLDATTKMHAAVFFALHSYNTIDPISLLYISDSLNMKTCTEAHIQLAVI